MSTDFAVHNETELNAAIAGLNAGGEAGAYVITIDASGSFDLATDLTPIALPAGATLGIAGYVDMDGHGLVHGFSIAAGTVTFAGLSVSGTLAPVAGGGGWVISSGPGIDINLIDVNFPAFRPEGAAGSAIDSGGSLGIIASGSLNLAQVAVSARDAVNIVAQQITGVTDPGFNEGGISGGSVTTGVLTLQGIRLTNFTVSTDADLRAAIAAISLGGVSAGSSSYTITLAGDVALGADLPAIDLGSFASLTIAGQGHTLDGSGVARGFYLYSGNVVFHALTIADAVARGGTGLSGQSGGGGAGGLGGGLFIAQSGTAILDGVNFRNDSAIGGAGGHGSGGYSPESITGAAGGFGFGGTAGVYGGAGGFGAGGGGGLAAGGAGGYGAGAGAGLTAGHGGGGGLGAGGDIFVHAGGQLYLLSGTLEAGTVVAGTGTDGGANGQALGASIFLTGSQPFTLSPAPGKTVRIDGVIADTPVVGEPAGTQTQYQGGGSYTYGSFETSGLGGFISYTWDNDLPPGFTAFPGFGFVDPFTLRTDPTLPAAGGTVILNGVNTYTSGTQATGTLELGNASAAGSGTIALLASNGLLRVHGTTLPANTISGLARVNAIALPELALAQGAYAFDPANGNLALPLLAGGTATLHTTGAGGAYLAAMVAPDHTGGSHITLDYAATLSGAAAGLVAVPMPDGAYVATAQTLLAADSVGGVGLHQSGGVAMVTNAVELVSGTAPASLVGAGSDNHLVLSGTQDLTYVPGTGSATLVSGGGHLLANLVDGHGDQTLFLGLGASTILAGAGRATIDGNRGGKLLLAAGGETLFISHADTVTADTIVGAGGAASVQSQGNVIATGHFAALDFDPDAGTSRLLGITGALRLEGDGGTALVTTDGTLAVTQPVGFATILGGGAGTRLTLDAGTPGQGSGGIVSAGAGSMTVHAGYWGTLYGGTAGANDITLTDGYSAVAGGGANDRIAFAGTARGIAFAADGAATLDGSAGSGHVTWVAGTGATTLSTGTGGSMAWLGAGTAQVASHGADTIVAGAGAATVTAGAAGVLAFAATGAFTFLNGAAASTVIGALGAMTIHGGAGGGLFYGAGNALLVADQGAATLVGGAAGDILTLANAANNLVVGGTGAETLGGAAATGTNAIYAGDGPDLLIAGAGTSFLFAAAGNDTLRGGTGTTQFVIRNGIAGGHITIEGMNLNDKVALNGYAPGELTTALASATSAGADTLLTLSDGTAITFLATASLSPSSFI